MNKIGKAFQRTFEQTIDRQLDLNGRAFSPVKEDTAKNRQRASNRIQKIERAKGTKGRIKGTVKVRSTKSDGVGGLNYKRLLFTRQLVHGAFRFQASPRQVRVFLNPAPYPGEDVTFSDIIQYNNKGSSRVNRHISNPPKIFPVNPSEVESTTAYKQAVDILTDNNTLRKLFGEAIHKQFTVEF